MAITTNMTKFYKILAFVIVFSYFPSVGYAQSSGGLDRSELDDIISNINNEFPDIDNSDIIIDPVNNGVLQTPDAVPPPEEMPQQPEEEFVLPEEMIRAQPEPQPTSDTTATIEEEAQVEVGAELDSGYEGEPDSEEVAEFDEEDEYDPDLEPDPKPIPYSGQYYDADSIGGNNAIDYGAPRQVDPKYEPGTRFVVVERSADSGSVQAQLIAAQRALKLGRHVAALDLFENLYKKTPNSIPVLMGLAISQQNNGFTESAIATYEQLLSLDPDNVEATVNMLGLMKGRYPAVAYRRLKELWENNAQNPAIAAQLGLTSAATGNTRDALRYLGIAASLEPNNASHFYNMAVLSDRAGARRDAMELYQRALEVDITYGGGKTVPREEIYDRLSFLRRM